MERAWLAEAVRGMLPHVQNPSYLVRQPLARQLVAPDAVLTGERVRRVLLDLIGDLKPVSAASAADAEWRQYQHLVLRYVDGHTRDQIASVMGVSTRQASRDHERAVEALIDLVKVRLDTQVPSDDSPGQPLPAAPDTVVGALLSEAASVAAVDSEPTDVSTTLEAIVATLAPLWATRGVFLRVLVPDTLPVVAVSRTLLRQAIVNALAHVTQVVRGGEILISATDTAHGPTIRLVGFGQRPIDPALVSDQSLEVSRRLLETQGGAVGSTAEAGSYCVTLTLPSIQLRKVLVVDDNPDVVMLFQRYLRGEPYRVVQATSAAEALRLSLELRPDVVTLDVMLPTQDGWDILQHMRSHPETRDTPLIVCSVLPEREIALSLGAADFLAKPVTRSALLQALDRCLAAPGGHPDQS